MSQVETFEGVAQVSGGGPLAGALVLMVGTLAGLAGGFLALMMFRPAGGADGSGEAISARALGQLELPFLCPRKIRYILSHFSAGSAYRGLPMGRRIDA